MKRNILGGIIGLFFLFVANHALSWTPYDDFPGPLINTGNYGDHLYPTHPITPPRILWKEIGTRAWFPSGREGVVVAFFDDAMVNKILLKSVNPSHGGLGSTIDFTLHGGGFQPGSTVKLTNFTLINPPNQISIEATNVNVSSSSQITGTFNLSGAVPGPWNITVTNPSPDGRSAVLPNGFMVVNTTPPITTAYPVGGTYNAPLSVSLMADQSATIYCTTDESEPSLESPICSAPIFIPATTTLKFRARDASGNMEATKTEVYTIGGNLTGTIEINHPNAAPGEPIPVTATFRNNTGNDLITVYPDCFNTLFIVTDKANQPLPPTCRIRGAYIIPSPLPATIPYWPKSAGDLTTIKANSSFTVTCDLSEVYHPQILTSNSDGSAKTYSVRAEYGNYITDETARGLFLGSINSTTTKVRANVTIKKINETKSYTSLAVQPVIGLSGVTLNLLATLTSGHRPLSGKTVSFKLNGASKGSATTDALGVATLEQVSLKGFKPAIYSIGANFNGEPSYAESGGQAQLTVYNYSSFSAPVHKPPTWNVATAGQTIPLKWRITDASGRGVASISSWKLDSRPVSCPSASSVSQSLIPSTAESSAGSSGLQNLGNGYWQINWKTSKSYSDPAQKCRELILTLFDSTEKALFKFNK